MLLYLQKTKRYMYFVKSNKAKFYNTTQTKN